MKKVIAADLFCGAGGASTGFVRACLVLGLDYELLAINHWPVAVETHSANHPNVRHLCESVERVDPREAVPGGRLHLLLAGPECTHFSTARGGRPVNPQARASAWHILKWAQELYIDTILIENVPEFRTWGPINVDGRPAKRHKGETYRAFLAALRSLGYRVEDRILNSADYGDPTTRKRLFIMARRGKHQVRWPAPTHSKTGGATLFGQTKRWKAAREVIDWSVPGKSIFTRKKPLRPATIARILAGLEKFGGAELQPFLVILRRNQAGMSVDGPVPTLTTSGANVGVAQPFLVPMYGERPTQEPRTHGVDEPIPTIPATGGGKFGVVEPFLLHTTHGGRERDINAPVPTVTGANRGELGLVEAHVLPQHGGGALRPVREPLPTIATDGAIAVVEPFLVPYYGAKGERNPRVHGVDEPLRTQTAENRFALAQPYLTKYNRTATGAYSVDDPLDTVSTRDRFGVVQPFILQQQSNGAPRATDDPLPTIATAGKQALIKPFIAAVAHGDNPPASGRGNGGRVRSIDEPLPTVSASGNDYALVQPVIDGYVLDIHFRMLQPHELAAATSFPKSYVFHGSREDVVKQIGNSWTGELSFQLNHAALEDYAPRRADRGATRRTA